MDDSTRNRTPPKRPAEEDTAAMLAWFNEQEKYLRQEGKLDAATEAALMAELDAFGAKTFAANAEAQRKIVEEVESYRTPVPSVTQAHGVRHTNRVLTWLAVAICAIVVGALALWAR